MNFFMNGEFIVIYPQTNGLTSIKECFEKVPEILIKSSLIHMDIYLELIQVIN